MDELRLPHGTERPERPSRLIGLAAVIVGLGLCTGLAAIGLTATVPDHSATSTAQGPAVPTGVATVPGYGQSTPDAPPPRLSATGPLALIADDISLPREGDPGWSGTNYDVSLCPGPRATYPALTTVNDLRVLHSLDQNPRRVQLLAVAADEGAASGLVRQLSRPFENCRLRGAEAGARASAPIEGDQWQEGSMLALSLPGDDGDAAVNGYIVVARAGRAVVAQTIVGKSAPATDGSGIHEGTSDELQGFLDAMSERVCRYRAAGCYTPPPPVYAPPMGSVQLPDGSFQLPDGSVVAPDGTVLVPAPQPEPVPDPAGDPNVPQLAPPQDPAPAEPAPVLQQAP